MSGTAMLSGTPSAISSPCAACASALDACSGSCCLVGPFLVKRSLHDSKVLVAQRILIMFMCRFYNDRCWSNFVEPTETIDAHTGIRAQRCWLCHPFGKGQHSCMGGACSACA